MNSTTQTAQGGWIDVSEAFSDATAPKKSSYLRTDELGVVEFRLRSDDPVERVTLETYEGKFPPSSRTAWDILHCVTKEGEDLKIDCKSAALYYLFADVWKGLGLTKSSLSPAPEGEYALIDFRLEVVIPSNAQLKKPATLKLTATKPDGSVQNWTV